MDYSKLNKSYSFSRPQVISPLSSSSISYVANFKKNLKCKLPSLQAATESTTESIMTRIKLRKNRNPAYNIPPETAALVIKQYLLPMFDKTKPKNFPESKSMHDGLNISLNKEKLENLDSTFDNTVYGELKLSVKLANELEQAREDLRTANESVKLIEQSKILIEKEFNELKNKYDDLYMNFELLKFQTTQSIKNSQKYELQLKLVTPQLEEYKLQCQNNDNLSTRVDTEQSNATSGKDYEFFDNFDSDSKGKALELSHVNDLIATENLVIGERLRGLYNSFSELTKEKSMSELLQNQLSIAAKIVKTISEDYKSQIKTAETLLYERNELREEIIDMAKITDKTLKDRDKILAKFKEKISSFNTNLKNAVEEKDKYKLKFQDSDCKLVLLSEEYERLRLKLKKYNAKNHDTDETEEKLCNKCKKVYMEKDNFNWSCKNHISLYSGEIWWCCGQTGVQAPGCQLSKHVSKSDEEEKVMQREISRIKSSVTCPCCNGIGHSFSECPKDPNIKTVEEVDEEIDRLLQIKNDKKALQGRGFDLSHQVKQMLKNKLGDSAKSLNSLSSDRKERLMLGKGNGDSTFFADIIDIKKSVGFSKDTNIVYSMVLENSLVARQRRRSTVIADKRRHSDSMHELRKSRTDVNNKRGRDRSFINQLI